ncbi:MAG: hypothetical protein VKN72_17765 [Nostocales cyanobacterium 94392]|nr:hypothetical protein [Nostocales cyanobacterium 94392]
MRIKSVQQLRKWIVEKESVFSSLTENGSPLPDNIRPDFMGCNCKDSSGKKISGFFAAYHGMKSNVANFLSTGLQNAEDGQAIYEFIQNAADCESDTFYIFYDEQYFLAINNGIDFKLKDVVSILNTSQSSKSSDNNQAVDCDKIGRFGIGFKLVHRLVGKNEGLKELTEEYKGPILFSWSKLEHFESLLENADARNIEYDDNVEGEYPWLFKILITNFPAQPIEIIKDLDYKSKIVFKKDEFNNLIDFLKANRSNLDLSKLHRGSLFFLKLGEGKSQALDKHYQNDLKKGVECSLNMLKSLKTVILNNEYIEKLTLEIIKFNIPKDSDSFQEIDPTDKKCDIKILFGYLPYKKSRELKEHPNFYKYFPMGAEEHGLNFIIHCDAFRIETNRRELEEVPTNRAIFSWLTNEFINELNKYIKNQPENFREVYANLLLSNVPSKPWLADFLYKPLLLYISTKVPTIKGNFYSRDRVCIKKTSLDIDPQDFGIEDKEWFYWNEKTDSELVKDAENKLKLGSWKIENLIKEGHEEFINNWLTSTDEKDYLFFLKELNEISSSKLDYLLDKICILKIFKFTDDRFYSVRELQNNSNYLLVCYQDISSIQNTLTTKLDFHLSTINLAEYGGLLNKLKNQLEEHLGGKLFSRIAQKTSEISYNSLLNVEDKQNIFAFLNKLKVRTETLKKLILFKDNSQTLKPLEELLVINITQLPKWLKNYQIDDKEYFSLLNNYLLKEDEIYDKLIHPNWEIIIQKVQNKYDNNTIESFYRDIKNYFNSSKNKRNLTEYSCIYTNNSFKLVQDVFYSKYLSEVESYNELKVAIESLTNLQLPEKSIVKYLSKPPFQTSEDKLEEQIAEEYAELEQSTVESLIEFTTKNNESFFNFLYIKPTNKSGIYLITDKSQTDVYQYYTEKIKLKKYIELNLSDNLASLPTEFYYEKGNNQGLITDANLYKEILNTYFSDELLEKLIDVIKECGIKDVEEEFLRIIPSLTLIQEKAYKKSSYEYQVLELACECIIDTNNESLQEEFKRKVQVIGKQGVVYLVREAVKDEIVFEIDGNTYELSLSEILPRYTSTSGVVNKTLQQFKGLKTKLKSLFGIGENNISYEEVYEELKQDVSHLQNAHQIAFVVLYAKLKHNVDLLNNFTVITQNE